MKELFVSENSETLLLEDKKILIYRFIGDVTDEKYFEICQSFFYLTCENGDFKFIADLSRIGMVSFRAIAKVILKQLPTFMKELGSEITTTILNSSDAFNKASIGYTATAFKEGASRLMNYESFDSEEEAVNWLSKNQDIK